MSDLRKTILTPLIISVIAGFVAGGTAGVLGSQFVAREGASSFGGLLPSAFRKIGKPAPSTTSVDLPPPQPPVTDEEAATTDVVRNVSPAVISIVIEKQVSAREAGPLFPEEFFEEFGFPFELEVPAPPPTQPPQKRQVGGGSGFIISSDGLIITNKHVVFDDDAEYTVVTSDDKRYKAVVLARDPFIDLAVLKIEGENFPVVTLGDSDRLRIGQTVIAIGNALSEFSNTITKGVVSGINRRVVAGGSGIGTEVIEEAIQTDAAINPGNSGGPLVNLRGEVVGVNTATSRAGQLIGFAIPINVAKPIIESIKKEGRIVRPWIGVRYVIVTAELKAQEKLPVDYGALLIRGYRRTDFAVIPGSPADKAGLVENDIILQIDGVKITQEISLARQIQRHKVGDTLTLKVLSKGQEKVVKVVLEELKQ